MQITTNNWKKFKMDKTITENELFLAMNVDNMNKKDIVRMYDLILKQKKQVIEFREKLLNSKLFYLALIHLSTKKLLPGEKRGINKTEIYPRLCFVDMDLEKVFITMERIANYYTAKDKDTWKK